MHMCVLLMLLYGVQIWLLFKKVITTLQVNQRKCRGRCSTSHEETNNIHGTMKLRDTTSTAMNSRWNWGGHVLRMDLKKYTYTVGTWPGWWNVRRQKEALL